MLASKVANFNDRILSPVVNTVSKVGYGVIAAMMLVTVADVIGRRLFNHPVKGSYELSEFMLVIVVYFNLASCELRDGNVTIDLLVSRFRKRTQSIINSFAYVLFLLISCLLTWRLFVYGINEVGGYHTTVLQIPIFPFPLIAALGCFLLSFVVLVRLLLFLSSVVEK